MANNIYLRAIDISDCQRVYQWHNNADLYATLGGNFHPVSLYTVENWIKTKASYSEREVNFAICLKETSEHIGNIYLREIDYINRNGSLGMFLASPESRGKGYAEQALRLVIEYAFYTIGLERLFLHMFDDNQAARHLTEKCGFQLEGKMRRHTFKNGVFKDVFIMGLCRDEYVPKPKL